MLDQDGTENNKMKGSHEHKLQVDMSCVVVVMLVCFGGIVLYKLMNVHYAEGNFWATLIKEQFPVLVGLSMAVLSALFVTLFLRISTGDLEF